MSQLPNEGRNAVIPILFVTWGLVFLDRMAVLYLAPYIAPDLHLSEGQVGLLAGVMALCWAVSALVCGALSDRYGRKTLLVPMVVLFSLLSSASGLAHSYGQLLAVRALLGVAEGPCWAVLMALVEESSSEKHRGRNIGIVVSAAAIIGLAIAPVMTTQVAAHFGWRWAFFIAGIPGLIMAVLIGAWVPEPVERAAAAPGARSHQLAFGDLVSLLRYRNIWAAAVGAAGFMTWLFLVNAFAPLYITQVQHQSGTTAGFLLGAAGLGSFFLSLIGPTLSDRFGRRRVLAVLGLLCTVLPLALMVQALYGRLWVLAAILFVTQGGQAVAAICIVLIPSDSVPRRLIGSAIGFATLFGEAWGGFAAPIVAGSLAGRHGLALPLWMAAAGTVVVFLIALVLRPMRAVAAGAVVVVEPVR